MSQEKKIVLCRAAYLMFALCFAMTLTSPVAGDGTKTVTAKAIKLEVPDSWKSLPPNSNFRAAQFEIPNIQTEQESAELVVFHFGGPTGGIRANIQRWIDQFLEAGRTVVLSQGECPQGKYMVADIAGTWKQPDGPPFAQKTIDTPDSRVIGIVLVTNPGENEDYYFLKLSGPDALVSSQAKALRDALGANLAAERAFALADATN